jgi:hypothetical protein
VHPDTGGTGDGLTLRLLAEARDEALAYLGAQADDDSSKSPDHGWDARPKADPPNQGDGPGKGEGIACHGCGRIFSLERLEHQLVGGGIRGLAGSSMAPVCRACAMRAEERRKNRRFIAVAVYLGAVIFLWLTLV